jgi:hypothetical protein
MRHHIGRMRRLCYAFSKRPENHRAAVALCYVHFNFCHVVHTLRVTAAMAAGVTSRVWDLEEPLYEILSAPRCERPETKPLKHRQPAVPARALPAGRGFLRLVAGASDTPPSLPPAPPILKEAPRMPVQLRLFDDEGDDDPNR